jgi:hypothetical protein
MFIKKQFIAIHLILSISLFNILSNNKVDKIIFYPLPGNDQNLTHQGNYSENEFQVQASINSAETPDDIEEFYIEIPEQHFRIKYFDFCGSPGMGMCKLKLVINSSIESKFALIDNLSGKTAQKGKLKVGQNNVDLPYNRDFIRKPDHDYTFKYSINGNSEEVKIRFDLKYDGWPEEKIYFEPKTGTIDLKLKSEGKKVIKEKSNLVLDKKVLIRSGLSNLIFGGIIVLFSPKIEKLSEKSTKQWLNTDIKSSKRLVTTFGLGFTIYGLNSILRSLKKNKLKGEMFENDDEAMIYNRNLKEEYKLKESEWKDSIIVIVRVPQLRIVVNKEDK